MARTRKTENIIKEAHDWLGNFPALMRMEAQDKPPEEREEIAEIAAAIARTNSRLWQRWQRKQKAQISGQ